MGATSKKKCEFSSCRHCREKTNIRSTATFRNFAKQGRWELHCPCHLSSAGKSCWMQEASLAASLHSFNHPTHLCDYPRQQQAQGPRILLCSCTKSRGEDPLCDSHCGRKTKDSVQLCLSEGGQSHTVVILEWEAGKQKAQVREGKGSFHLHGGEQEKPRPILLLKDNCVL